jgi:Xaa-Pro dipeptidase
MITRIFLILISMMFAVPLVNAQPGANSSRAGGEILRQMRNQKLDLILPGAMRDNNVEMWIHVTRPGDPDPLVPQFGSTSGYLIFTDLGDRIERAVFGGAGAVENIDVRGSSEIARAVTGYDYGTLDFSVYDE